MPRPVGSPIDLDPNDTYFDSVVGDTFRVIKNNTVILHDRGKIEGSIIINYSSNPTKKVKATRMAEKIAAESISVVVDEELSGKPNEPKTQSEFEVSGQKSKVTE